MQRSHCTSHGAINDLGYLLDPIGFVQAAQEMNSRSNYSDTRKDNMPQAQGTEGVRCSFGQQIIAAIAG